MGAMTAQRDARSAWIVDTRPLGRGPGKMRPIERAIPVAEPLGLDLMRVPAASIVEFVGRLESVVEGVLVSGTATAQVTGECARCLAPVADMMSVEICEMFAYPGSATGSTTDADEVPRLESDVVDLEPVVHDALILAMPVAPRCSEDCQGLCAECGERRADLPADHVHERVDPRWAVLQELLVAPPDQAAKEKQE